MRRLTLALMAIATMHATAVADRPVVIESYEGTRPADATTFLAPVVAELQHRAYATDDEVVALLRNRVGGDPGELSPSQIVDAQKAVDRAYQHLIDGDYAVAQQSAEHAIALYQQAPALLAREEALRTLEFKALLIAARSSEVLGRNDDAFRWMAEAVRAFGGQAPSAAEFDPSVIALHRKVTAELKRQGGGALDVHATDSAVTIFVDERFAGTGEAQLTDIAPGRYRVYAIKGTQVGRIHVVDVAPNARATVEIDWDVDAGFSIANGAVFAVGRFDDLAVPVRIGHALGAARRGLEHSDRRRTPRRGRVRNRCRVATSRVCCGSSRAARASGRDDAAVRRLARR